LLDAPLGLDDGLRLVAVRPLWAADTEPARVDG
jgi:hypothetical protein